MNFIEEYLSTIRPLTSRSVVIVPTRNTDKGRIDYLITFTGRTFLSCWRWNFSNHRTHSVILWFFFSSEILEAPGLGSGRKLFLRQNSKVPNLSALKDSIPLSSIT